MLHTYAKKYPSRVKGWVCILRETTALLATALASNSNSDLSTLLKAVGTSERAERGGNRRRVVRRKARLCWQNLERLCRIHKKMDYQNLEARSKVSFICVLRQYRHRAHDFVMVQKRSTITESRRSMETTPRRTPPRIIPPCTVQFACRIAV